MLSGLRLLHNLQSVHPDPVPDSIFAETFRSFRIGTGGFVEILIDESGRWLELADRERIFAQAVQRCRKSLHMSDFTRHQKLQSILGSAIIREMHQPLVGDLRTSFSGDIAAQI